MGDATEPATALRLGAEGRDDLPTVVAIAVLAFIVADLAHEVVGHGLAYLAVGGRSFVMTTTRLIGQGVHVDAAGRLFVGVVHGDLYGRIFSLGGPLGGLLCAALAWLALRRVQPRPRRGLFLWLTTAFNLFWSFGYLMLSGATGVGDWIEGIRDVPPAWLWRSVLFAGGLLLYLITLRTLGHGMGRIVPRDAPGGRARVRRLTWIAYWSAGVIACAGAVFDPRGPDQVYNSGALASFAAALGLLRMPGTFERFARQSDAGRETISRSLAWILVAGLAAALYVGVLGPGVRVSVP